MRTTVPCVRTFVLSIAFLLSGFLSKAQSLSTSDGKFEVGVGVGPLFFLGDLGGNKGVGTSFVKDVNLPLTKLAKGFHLNLYPVEWLGFRLAANQGMLEGADSLIKDNGGDETTRKVRNLSFRSNMLEAYGAIEFYPTVFFEQYEGLKGKFRPYGVIGLGFFHYNPQALYYSPNGTTRWVDLQPLRLEGQGMKEYPNRPEYKLTQMEIPMGVGFKYYLQDNFYLGFEVLHRKTFTDYVDDVSKDYIDANLFDKYLAPDQSAVAHQLYDKSFNNLSRPAIGEQRGNPKNNDAFFSTVVRCGWRIDTYHSPKQLLCPKF